MFPFVRKCPLQINASLKIPSPDDFSTQPVQPINVDLRVGELFIDISPAIVHTSISSLVAWTHSLLKDGVSDDYLWSTKKKYLICNDTNQRLILSQTNAVEKIILDSRCCIPYSWYDRSLPLLLCIGNEDGDWQLSQVEAINLDLLGIKQYTLDPDKYGPDNCVIVNVEQINTGQNKVTLMGRLSIWNMVTEEILLKITYEDNSGFGYKIGKTLSIKENSNAPSMMLPYSTEKILRVKFMNIETGFSGDIPVKESSKENVPWLVKIPMLSNKNHFMSIWCRVICDKESRRICISLWPLYIIKSHLPLQKQVTIRTSDFDHCMSQTLSGKGSYSSLLCLGTTITKHDLIFNNRDNSDINQVSVHYGTVDKTKFFHDCHAKSSFDTVISIFEDWLEKSKSPWPYSCVQSLCDGAWMPAEGQPNTHITVNFESAGPQISSLIIEVCPWGLMVNSSDLFVAFNIPNGQEICSAQPGEVVMTTSKFTDDNFVVSIVMDDGSLNISDFVTVKNVEVGVYEVNKSGVLNVESHCPVSIICTNKICFLTLYYEVKENINIFGVSSTYLLMNHLDIEIDVGFVAVTLSSDMKCDFLINPDIFMKIPAEQHKLQLSTPVPFFYFHPFDISNDYEALKNCALYIVVSLDNFQTVTCPVRVDKFTHRRAVSTNYQNYSEPLVITCQEYRGQTIISIHKDEKPQLLIRNQSDLLFSIGQVINKHSVSFDASLSTNSSYIEVQEECQHLNWRYVVHPKNHLYYSTPSYSENFPLIKIDESPQLTFRSSIITFSCYSEESNTYSLWTAPVDTATNITEQFMKLPNLNRDVKISVECHAHTSLVTIKNVTQLDISASVIRQRLIDNIPNENQLKECASTSHNSHIKVSKSYNNLDNDPLSQNSEIYPVLKIEAKTSFSIIFDHIILILTSGSKNEEKVGILYLDYLAIDGLPTTEGMAVTTSVLEMQYDNVMHLQESFDFPVSVIRQNPLTISLPWPTMWSVQTNQSIINLIRQSCLIKISIKIDTWKAMESSICALRDVTIETAPVSLYIEDTYISVVLDYFSDMILNNYSYAVDDLNSEWRLKIPMALIRESASLAKPLVLRSLTIKPVSLSLSMHTSVHLYLALDHSPLNFESFQRNNLITSSYRLGLDLVMHYLSGAIVGAGWVVGSLEILGSPGGLVRRVGNGLRDLVLEPWNGLAYGPQAFLAGAAYGTWSLARELTQGAVQSVSMVCGSVARNLDLLSLDDDHVRRAGAERRRRPAGVLDALSRGFAGLAVSVLGAVGGIAHHPIVAPTEGNNTSMAGGITRGLLGVVTKPLSATADLVALAGQGLLSQAGWDNQPQFRPFSLTRSSEYKIYASANARLNFLRFSPEMEPLHACHSSNPVLTLVITHKWLLVLENDRVRKSADLCNCFIRDCRDGNTVQIELKDTRSAISSEKRANMSMVPDQSQDYEENDAEMISAIKERVARYIGGIESSNNSVPLLTSAGSSGDCITIEFENMQAGFFCDVLTFAKREYKQEGFSVL